MDQRTCRRHDGQISKRSFWRMGRAASEAVQGAETRDVAIDRHASSRSMVSTAESNSDHRLQNQSSRSMARVANQGNHVGDDGHGQEQRKLLPRAFRSIEYEEGVYFADAPNENRPGPRVSDGIAGFAPIIITATVYWCGRRGDRR